MTLDEALTYARQYQPSLRAAQARAQAAVAETRIPRAQWYPRGGATAQLFGGTANNTTSSYVATYGVDVPRIGGTGAATQSNSNSWQPYASSFVGIGLRQELFDFGRIAAQSAVFDAAAEAEGLRATSERLSLDLAVSESYFAVHAAKAVLEAARAAYERVKANTELARMGVKSGLRSPIELTRAEADLIRLDVGRIRAQGGLVISQEVFAAVVGVPQASLDVAGEAPLPTTPPPLQRVLDTIEAKDPTILEAQARLRTQQAHSSAILSELRPDLQVTSLLSGRAGGAPTSSGAVPAGSGFLPDLPNWDVGVALSWEWFDETVFARHEASLRHEDAERAALEGAKLQTRTAIEQAYASVEVAFQAVPALERSAAAAKDNYAQADARFRAGLGTSVELADAEALRTEAEIQLALGKFDYARARVVLARAIAEGL